MAAELLTDASRASDANNHPFPGAKWYFYATGTTTPQSVYTTAELDTPHTNPVIADAGGNFPPIYFDATKQYRGVLENATGTTTIHDIDPINSSVIASLGATTGAGLVGIEDGGNVQDAVAVAATPVQLLASTKPLSVGSTVQTSDGFRYEVVASGETENVLTTAGGVKIRPVVNGPVRPEHYGIAGDGSDETANWRILTDWARVAGSVHLILTPGKVYAYTNPWLFVDIPYLRIDANGASFRNIRASELGPSGTFAANECLHFASCFNERLLSLDTSTTSDLYYGPLIETCAAGDTTITLKSSESAADFVVGKRALIYGYATQTTGFPNTSLYFEYVDVVAIDGLDITLKRPLKYSYFDDWYEPVVSAHAYKGKPRILSLWRDNFKEQAIEINELVFSADPGREEVDGGTAERNGRPTFGGYSSCTLNNCVIEGGMYPSQGGFFTDNQSKVAESVEVDKFIDTFVGSGIDYGQISQGTGCRHLILKDGFNLRKINVLSSLNSVELSDGFVKEASGATHVFANTFPAGNVRVSNVEMGSFAGYAAIVSHYTHDAAMTKVSETSIKMTQAVFVSSFFYRHDLIGKVLYDSNANPIFRCSESARASGTDVTITGQFLNSTWTSGTLSISQHASFHIDNSFTNRPRGLPIVQPSNNKLALAKIRTSNIGEGRTIISSRELVGLTNTDNVRFIKAGAIKPSRITINVREAYTGPTGTAAMCIRQNQSGTFMATINLKTVGVRVLDIGGEYGSVTGDTLTGLAGLSLLQLGIKATAAITYDNPSEEAIWDIVIEGSGSVEGAEA